MNFASFQANFMPGMPGMPSPMQLASRSAYPACQTQRQLASRSACPACQTQSNWLHDRHAGHAKPNATGFTVGMPGMPNPMQLASRSACPACQTQCNWIYDRHARHAKPDEQTGVLPVTIPETIVGHFSVPVPFSLLKWRMVFKLYLPEISVCNANIRRRLKLKNEYR